MNTHRTTILLILSVCSVLLLTASAPQNTSQTQKFPYNRAGMTERQAAAYLLDRFAFGARPSDIENVLKQGLENWFESQLQNTAPEPELQTRLAPLTTLTMSTPDIARTFPNIGFILRQAKAEGVPLPDKIDSTAANNKEYRQKLIEFARSKGYRLQRELMGEMYAQKLLRAVYARNQLGEVLTDFWFNHFNVSITDNQAQVYVPTFERDAIRPNVLSSFRQLLGATAKHPAMLAYLDNAQSTAPNGTPTTMSRTLDTLRNKPGVRGAMQRAVIDSSLARTKRQQEELLKDMPEELKPRKGINENYARELMELHTLGVDGGYTQKDVTEAARVLTGWTLFPPGPRGEKLAERLERGKAAGFVREGDFLFRADAHDATEKTVLGVKFPAGGGMDEGEKLLDMVAQHPSTATFITTKLARRFVADAPPASLLQTLARVFTDTKGDLKAVMRALAYSPEFWSAAANKEVVSGRTKIKSPFELAVGALRAMNADIERPREVLEWVRKIGQPLYAYQAPTGFPDRAEAWINTGALLNRMNFGLNLAIGNVRGVQFDLAALNHNHEPESAEHALQIYAALLLPERNISETVRLLKPIVLDPAFAEKVDKATTQEGDIPKPQIKPRPAKQRDPEPMIESTMHDDDQHKPQQRTKTAQPSTVAQVVGIILGSPEFQRR